VDNAVGMGGGGAHLYLLNVRLKNKKIKTGVGMEVASPSFVVAVATVRPPPRSRMVVKRRTIIIPVSPLSSRIH